MSTSATEDVLVLVAKPCGSLNRHRKIIYSVLDRGDILCMDKKEIILGQLDACQTLLKCSLSEPDRTLVEKEMSDLKLALDLIS